MSQSRPWVATCPERVRKRIAACTQAGYVLHRHSDPTKFQIQTRDGKKLECSVGSTHKCSCTTSQPCAHVLFVLMSFFKVPETNASLWQGGVSELQLSDWIASAQTSDNCFFCHEIVLTGRECGACSTRLHDRCSQLAAVAGKCKRDCCPRCSAELPPSKRESRLTCHVCASPCTGEFYKCLLCDSYIMCVRCYQESRVHVNHPFSLQHQGAATPVTTSPAQATIAELQFREINPEDYEALSALDGKRQNGISASAIANLRRAQYSLSGSINQACPVCQHNYSAAEVCLILPCRHTMHYACGRRWLSTYSDKCPIDHLSVLTEAGIVEGEQPTLRGSRDTCSTLTARLPASPSSERTRLPAVCRRK